MGSGRAAAEGSAAPRTRVGRGSQEKSRPHFEMARSGDGTDCFAETFPFSEVCASAWFGKV